MKIKFVNHRGKIILLAVICLLIVGLFINGNAEKYGYRIGNGYRLLDHGHNARSIRKDGSIIIEPSIVEWSEVSDFVVGLRMPTRTVVCEPDSQIAVLVCNKKEYFILSMETGAVFEFESKQAFENKLAVLEILDDVALDYSVFDTVWNKVTPSYKSLEKYCS